MTKLEITTALTNLGITHDPSATVPVLQALLDASATPALAKPANRTIVLSRQNIRDIKTRSTGNAWITKDSKTAIAHPAGFNTYSFEGTVNGKKESFSFNAWEERFITNKEAGDIYSIELASDVTDTLLEADAYGNPAQYQTYWELGSIVTRKDHAQNRQDAKDDKEDARAERLEKLETQVFNIQNFNDNPELIKSSGFMDSIMNASVGA
jgi:hypothetical protein